MPRLASGGSPPAARCAAGPLIRRDVMIAPPLRTRGAHAHYPCGAMGTSRPTAITPAIFARGGSPPRPTAITHARGAPDPQKIACGGSPPLCSYTSRSVALCAPLCLKIPPAALRLWGAIDGALLRPHACSRPPPRAPAALPRRPVPLGGVRGAIPVDVRRSPPSPSPRAFATPTAGALDTHPGTLITPGHHTR